jgi:DNA-binding CsgD family transcriptional regulator
MQKRRFGIMTPYRAIARAGRSRVTVMVSPIPIFGPDGTFRGSLATFTEDVGGGVEESLNRYRDEVQAVVAAGSELVLQLDHLTGGEKEAAARRPRPRRGSRRGTRMGSPRQVAMAQLTPKEREIAGRLTTGMRVAEIAHALTISISTVRNHLKSIFRKLDVRSQIELVTLLGK